jgi:hypothetical protein
MQTIKGVAYCTAEPVNFFDTYALFSMTWHLPSMPFASRLERGNHYGR